MFLRICDCRAATLSESHQSDNIHGGPEEGWKDLEIFSNTHVDVPVSADDCLIGHCYGVLQGKRKRKVARERPEWFEEIRRGYDFLPPEGESLKLAENRTLPFVKQLEKEVEREHK